MPGRHRDGRPTPFGTSATSTTSTQWTEVATPIGVRVMVMHEFPGVSTSLVEFADALADHFRVVVPSILGRDGHPSVAGTVAQLCIRPEVCVFKTGATSRAVPWLRDLLEAHVSRGDPCGVVGMCLSGGFALALAVNPAVRAAVVAQPAVPVSRIGPLPLPGRRLREGDLGLTMTDRTVLTQRAAQQPDGLCARGYRFARDPISPAAKLAAAQALLGQTAMQVVTLDRPDATQHSTLTGENRSPTAVADVIDFLIAELGQ